mmetsp:Transcript_33341/g.94900  ORF Transcript_33341/g.94900 Transcript_33341/m.94900 type:complete len:226 (+) Transcript_33341:428-1105(+)
MLRVLSVGPAGRQAGPRQLQAHHVADRPPLHRLLPIDEVGSGWIPQGRLPLDLLVRPFHILRVEVRLREAAQRNLQTPHALADHRGFDDGIDPLAVPGLHPAARICEVGGVGAVRPAWALAVPNSFQALQVANGPPTHRLLPIDEVHSGGIPEAGPALNDVAGPQVVPHVQLLHGEAMVLHACDQRLCHWVLPLRRVVGRGAEDDLQVGSPPLAVPRLHPAAGLA